MAICLLGSILGMANQAWTPNRAGYIANPNQHLSFMMHEIHGRDGFEPLGRNNLQPQGPSRTDPDNPWKISLAQDDRPFRFPQVANNGLGY